LKIGAYQAPLLPIGSMEAIDLIRTQIARCENEEIEILCCPEAILGDLADSAADPAHVAVSVENGQLEEVLAPLSSKTVSTIIGFTESTSTGQLYNSAAVLDRGSLIGLYRKAHPRSTRRSTTQATMCQRLQLGP